MNKYSEIVEKLNWKNALEVQEKAIEELSCKKDWDYSNAIINSDKGCWENLFKVFEIKKVDDNLLINDYLFLLKDLNWPGALKAFEKLKSMKKGFIRPHIASSLNKAEIENDEDWKGSLLLLNNYFGF